MYTATELVTEAADRWDETVAAASPEELYRAADYLVTACQYGRPPSAAYLWKICEPTYEGRCLYDVAAAALGTAMRPDGRDGAEPAPDRFTAAAKLLRAAARAKAQPPPRRASVPPRQALRENQAWLERRCGRRHPDITAGSRAAAPPETLPADELCAALAQAVADAAARRENDLDAAQQAARDAVRAVRAAGEDRPTGTALIGRIRAVVAAAPPRAGGSPAATLGYDKIVNDALAYAAEPLLGLPGRQNADADTVREVAARCGPAAAWRRLAATAAT